MEYHGFKTNSIKDDYEFKAILGEGAFGKVIQAIKRDNNEYYAIKMVGKSELDDEDLRNLFFEITVLDKIDHPNVTKMIEAYDNPTAYFIVLELMEGGELFDRIVDLECYSENLAANTLKPIVDGIKYCHDLNIAHRDLKPENLLYLTDEDESIIKISDFGLAKLQDSAGQMMSTVCGTPSYLAPEIISGQKYTTQCDIWSLGVILYTLQCGYPPFSDEDNSKMMSSIKTGKIDFSSSDWEQVSDEAKDLISACLTVDPAKRIKCAGILAHPWIVNECSHKNNSAARDRLKKYQARRRLKLAQTVVYFSKVMERKIR